MSVFNTIEDTSLQLTENIHYKIGKKRELL